MLSSAHILAMDTKNLLDVCDSIRARFPHVKYEIPEGAVKANLSDDPHNSRLPLQLQSPLQQEFYENVSKTEAAAVQAELIYCNPNPPTDVGIYDNQAAIQEQLKIIEDATSPVDPQFNSQKILSN